MRIPIGLQVAYRPLPHHGSPPIQACPHVHPRRDRCGIRPLAYATHWTAVPYTIQGVAVHRSVAEGRFVHECECVIQGEVPGWDVDRRTDSSKVDVVIVRWWR